MPAQRRDVTVQQLTMPTAFHMIESQPFYVDICNNYGIP